MSANERHHKTAKNIIEGPGFAFALASLAGKPGDLAIARNLLRDAIIKALADAELNSGKDR
jgi:hypothetical protein